MVYLVDQNLSMPIRGSEFYGEFAPPNLFGKKNQCRNNRRWPFVVADPICLVAHPTSGRPVFDLCAVPLCATDRKLCERFKIQNSRLKIQNSKFKIQDSRFKIQKSSFKIQNSKFKIQDSKFKIKD